MAHARLALAHSHPQGALRKATLPRKDKIVASVRKKKRQSAATACCMEHRVGLEREGVEAASFAQFVQCLGENTNTTLRARLELYLKSTEKCFAKENIEPKNSVRPTSFIRPRDLQKDWRRGGRGSKNMAA